MADISGAFKRDVDRAKMPETKHPAKVLADQTAQAADAYDLPGIKRAADMLRRIPALEAELKSEKSKFTACYSSLCVTEAERDELRAEVMEQARLLGMSGERELALRAEIDRLRKDADRLDWLADPSNTIGNVQLPRECVEQNLHSLRDAIDAARTLK